MNKSRILRRLLKEKDLIRLVGAHNGLSAKLVEKSGFDGVWASSLEVSASHAVPDANILTMTDYLNAATAMNDVISIPVVVDIDQGYGNSNNVIRTIKKFEAAGIAGVCMEDKKFPKQNSLLSKGRQELASIPEFVGKILAAKNAQRSEDFVVIARVEALIAGWGQEEAMKRAKAYARAGADVIMIHSKSSTPNEVIEFVESWEENVPIMVVPTNYYNFTEDEILKYPKIKIVTYANHGIRAAVGAMKATLDEIRVTKGIASVSSKLIPVKELFELQGTTQLKEDEKKFVVSDNKPVKVIIPAAGLPPESLKAMLGDTPLAMLDINGNSLLQRNVEQLNSLGINDITIVSGYGHEKITIENANVIYNDNWENSTLLGSIMAAIADNPDPECQTLIINGDILFEPSVIKQLLKHEQDVVAIIDKSYQESKFLDKKLDLVVAKFPPVSGDRIINTIKENVVLEIGPNIPREEASHEFTGISLFSAEELKL